MCLKGQSSFSLLTKKLGKAENVMLPNLNFFRLLVFKIIQFQIDNSSLASGLPLFQYRNRSLTFGKLAYTILTLYFVFTTALLLNLQSIKNMQ